MQIPDGNRGVAIATATMEMSGGTNSYSTESSLQVFHGQSSVNGDREALCVYWLKFVDVYKIPRPNSDVRRGVDRGRHMERRILADIQ